MEGARASLVLASRMTQEWSRSGTPLPTHERSPGEVLKVRKTTVLLEAAALPIPLLAPQLPAIPLQPSPELTIAGPCSSSCRRAPAVSVQRTSTHQMSSSGNATRLSSQPPSLRCVSTAGIARSTSEAVLLAQASSCTTLPDSQPLQVSAQAFRAPTERRRRRRGRHYEAGHAEAQPGRDPWEPGSQAKQKPGGLDPRIDGSHEPTRAWLVYARLRALDGTC